MYTLVCRLCTKVVHTVCLVLVCGVYQYVCTYCMRVVRRGDCNSYGLWTSQFAWFILCAFLCGLHMSAHRVCTVLVCVCTCVYCMYVCICTYVCMYILYVSSNTYVGDRGSCVRILDISSYSSWFISTYLCVCGCVQMHAQYVLCSCWMRVYECSHTVLGCDAVYVDST